MIDLKHAQPTLIQLLSRNCLNSICIGSLVGAGVMTIIYIQKGGIPGGYFQCMPIVIIGALFVPVILINTVLLALFFRNAVTVPGKVVKIEMITRNTTSIAYYDFKHQGEEMSGKVFLPMFGWKSVVGVGRSITVAILPNDPSKSTILDLYSPMETT